MGRITVRLYDGRVGSIDEEEYNPQSMTRLDAQKPQVQEKPKTLSQNIGESALGALGSILQPGINLINKGLGEQQKAVQNTKKGDILGAIINAAKATKNTFASPETAKVAAEEASLAVPFGKAKEGASLGMRALTKYLIPGAAAGGLQGLSEENATPQSVVGNSVLGAGGAGILGSLLKVGKVSGDLTKKALGSAGLALEGQATKSMLKSSPSAFKNAVEEHGLDINKIFEKHFKGTTNYDEILGPVKDKGSGGLLGGKIGSAEKVIDKEIKTAGSTIRFSSEELTNALQKEKNLLKKTVGNDEKIADIEQLIKDTGKRFKNGISAKQLLDLKRAADSKFGKAVTETEKGSVVTSTQKTIANTARKLLKSRFKNIANALDEETELYTLKPILNSARAGEAVGGKSGLGITDLLALGSGGLAGGPVGAAATYGLKKAVGSPKILGGLGGILNKASQGIPQTREPNPIIAQILGQGATRGATALGSGAVTKAQPNGNEYSNNPPQDGFHDGIIPQPVNQQEDKTAIIKQALAIAMLQDLSTGGKNIPELKAISEVIDKLGPQATNKKYSEGDKKFLLAKNEATKAMSLLDKGDVTSGKFAAAGSKIGEFFGTQDPKTTTFKAQLSTARTAARNALLGANMSDKELESYLDAIFSYSNEPQIIKAKLATFIQSMQDYENSIAGTGTGVEDLQTQLQ